MEHRQIPNYYHPATVLFVDDSERVLTKINLGLDERLAYTCFSDPRKALTYIQKYGRARRSDHQSQAVCDELYASQRFNEPTVMVIDFAMPGLNGFELCEKVDKLCAELKLKQIKRILLTGQASEAVGTEGLQKGLIHHYISKKDPEHKQKLNQAIEELQQQSFLEQIVMPGTPEELQLFKQLHQTHQIVEYYPVNHAGDYVLLQWDGTLLWWKTGMKEFVKNPALIEIQTEKVVSFQKYLEQFWPPII